MGQFLDTLNLRDTENDDGPATFEVLGQFRYQLGNPASGVPIQVPDGTLTDFASIPRIFWSIYPPAGSYRYAAVLHDWLCRTEESGYSRPAADGIFFDAMCSLGVPRLRRYLIYGAVRFWSLFTQRG